eukprot:PhM_4_TR9566/c2_g1_i1/m.38114
MSFPLRNNNNNNNPLHIVPRPKSNDSFDSKADDSEENNNTNISKYIDSDVDKTSVLKPPSPARPPIMNSSSNDSSEAAVDEAETEESSLAHVEPPEMDLTEEASDKNNNDSITDSSSKKNKNQKKIVTIDGGNSTTTPVLMENSNNSNNSHTTFSRPRHPFSIRLSVIMCLFVTFSIAISFCTLYFVTQIYERRTIRELATLYTREVDHNLHQFTIQYMDEARALARRYAGMLEYDNTSFQTWSFHHRVLRNIAATREPLFYSVFFGDVEDRFYEVILLSSQNKTTTMVWKYSPPGMVSDQTDPLTNYYNSNNNNNNNVCQGSVGTVRAEMTNTSVRLSTLQCLSTSFKATARPWYVRAKNEMAAVWSNFYVFASVDRVGVTISVPVLLSSSSNNRFVGVVGVDVLGENLQKYLTTYSEMPDGTELFIVEDATGNLLATRRADIPVSVYDPQLQTARPVTVRSTSHKDMYEALAKDTYRETNSHDVDGRHYYTTRSIISLPTSESASDAGGASYTLYVAVPESSFSHLLTEGKMVGGLVALAVGIVCVVTVATYIYLTLRPIQHVSHDLARVAHLDLDDVAMQLDDDDAAGKHFSIISELQALRESFVVVVRRLQEYRSYMPRSLLTLVRGVDRPSDDDDDDDDDD